MASNVPKYEDIEIYPVSASELGTNLYHLPLCSVVGHQPAYPACLNKIKERKLGRLKAIYSECSAAIGKKECPAQVCRKQELDEGRALFYINRDKMRAFNQYREEMAAQSMSAPDERTKPRRREATPVPQPTIAMAIPDTGDYAAAINRAVQEDIKKQMATVTPAAPLKSGMSLIEMARARMAEKQSTV